MGMMRRNKRKTDAANVEKFLDDLRQEMGNNGPLPAKAPPTLAQFLASAAFLTAQIFVGAVIVGVALRIVLAVAGL